MENIQVALRLRPMNRGELESGEHSPWKVHFNSVEVVKNEGENRDYMKKPVRLAFSFDFCFNESHTNEEVYSKTAKNVIMSCLEGYNGTLFMYGQTGSGKTYTMLGYNKTGGLYNETAQAGAVRLPKNNESPQGLEFESEDEDSDLGIENLHEKLPDFVYDSHKTDFESNTGILIQGLRDIFAAIGQDKERTFFLKCSYFEIYNDQIYDLLKPRGEMHESLQLVEDVKRDTFVIKGITEESVASIKQIFERLKKGEMNRHYAETFMNHSSSRSHCIFRLGVRAVTNAFIKSYRQQNEDCANVNVLPDMDHTHDGTVVTESHLNFVDLAGSERMSVHLKNPASLEVDELDAITTPGKDVAGRVKEGKHINRSLFFLTQVISLKAEGKPNQHIPYRNSPLTKILRSSLGGNFRTAVVLCINPTASQMEHSISTLRFGQNAKKVQNKVRANVITNNNEETVRILVENYEKRIRDLQAQQDHDLSKYEHYIGVIEELKLQRTTLLERLEALNKKFSVKLLEEIPERELHKFFKAVRNRSAFFENVGFVFSSAALERDYQHLKEDESGILEEENPTERLKGKFSREMESDPRAFLGQMSVKLYQKAKGDFDRLKMDVERQNGRMVSLCHSYKTMCEFMQSMTGLGQTYLLKLNQIIEQYQDEYVLSNERKIKLELYESFRGLSVMSGKDLDTMTDYLADFAEAIKSEKDRRELLEKQGELPSDLLEGLEKLRQHEQEEQDEHMNSMKEKMEDFVKFKEGCSAEIEYYKSLHSDFNKQNQVEVRIQEVDKFINEDMVEMTERIEVMNTNFLNYDSTIEKDQKKELNLKLKEYKTKFEKLVDVVLAKRKAENLKEEIPVSGYGERPSRAPSTGRAHRRSNSITGAQEIFGLNSKAILPLEKSQISSKVRTWLNLKAIEDRTMNFESALKDDTTSMSNFRSPLNRPEIELNGSFYEIKSQNLNVPSVLVPGEQFASKRLDTTQKKSMNQVYENEQMDPMLTPRKEERQSYKLSDYQNNGRSLKNYEIGGSPRGKQTNGVNRRVESKSYKASDYDALNRLKRSFSNVANFRLDSPSHLMKSSLFGSATDFNFRVDGNNLGLNVKPVEIEDQRSSERMSNGTPLISYSKPNNNFKQVPNRGTTFALHPNNNYMLNNSKQSKKARPSSISLKKDSNGREKPENKIQKKTAISTISSKCDSSQKQLENVVSVKEEEKKKPPEINLQDIIIPKRAQSKPSIQETPSFSKERNIGPFSKTFAQSSSNISQGAKTQVRKQETSISKLTRSKIESFKSDYKYVPLKKV